MIADFWNELFALGDEMKEEYGINSPEYKTVKEMDRRFQAVYDKHNKLTKAVLDKSLNDIDVKELLNIKDLMILKDDKETRYRIGHHYFETPGEVMQYIIDDRNKSYNVLWSMFDEALTKAVEYSANKLYNKACADFHEELDKKKALARKTFKLNLLKEQSQ